MISLGNELSNSKIVLLSLSINLSNQCFATRIPTVNLDQSQNNQTDLLRKSTTTLQVHSFLPGKLLFTVKNVKINEAYV